MSLAGSFRTAAHAAPLLAALAIAGCASESATTATAAAGSGRQCFFVRNVESFHAVDDRTVNLRVGVSDVYRAELFAPCHDVLFAQGVAIRSRGGSSSICSPLDAELVAPSPIGPQRCLLSELRKLSPQEVAALAPRDRP
jgi:hypothetical protein